MADVILASEAVADGLITRGRLRWHYRPLFPDVHIPRGCTPSLRDRTVGAWLWSRRRGVVTGRAAAALHGAKWVDPAAPVELLWANNHAPDGIIARRERIPGDETCTIDGMTVATPARAALDLGRHLPRGAAVGHLDALIAATGLAQPAILALAARYPGTKGVRACREAVALTDGGAQSPKETWLRLLLVDAGFPTPQTQIPLLDGGGYPFAYLDMGWRAARIAVEYDGDHHRSDRAQYAWDVKRLRMITGMGWLHVRVIAEDSADDVCDRVRRAFAQRGREGVVAQRSA